MSSSSKPSQEITAILLDLGTRPPTRAVTDVVFSTAYRELRAIANRLMTREREDHTLQPTALVNEAYVRLTRDAVVPWQSRAHFFGIATRAMRQILVEHARRKTAQKRGGPRQRVPLDGLLELAIDDAEQVLEVNEILEQLAVMDPRMARVVELRVFGGLTETETAEVLGVSRRTVTNDWQVARLWLLDQIDETRPQREASEGDSGRRNEDDGGTPRS